MTVSCESLPSVGRLTIVRLGLFNLGLGLMAVLTLAVLNRIMISELAIPATITAGILAIAQFVAPARVIFGQMSDAVPLGRYHRTGYVLAGTVVFGLAILGAVQAIWMLGRQVQLQGGWVWNGTTFPWALLLALLLAIYGLAICASSTPFTALLVDVSDEGDRSKLVAVVWSMLMVGIVIGGISGKIFLERVQQMGVLLGVNLGGLLATGDRLVTTPIGLIQEPINQLFTRVPLIVVGLAVIALWGVERTYSRFHDRQGASQREDSITLGQSLRILTASRQTAIFFGFLVLFTISLFMQEAVLEPYGGEVFGMAIGETTLLNSFWGMGILVGYGSTGFLVVPRLGKARTTQLGCFLVAIAFVLLILAGITQKPEMLRFILVLFGAAAGMATIGAISLMLDLTAAATAGTFIGAWGLAQAMARAFATLLGGIVLDMGKVLFPSPLPAYGLVFGLQAVGMLGAIVVLRWVNVQEFRATTAIALETVMAGDLD